ncbi:MAG: hypothetical protein HYX61_07215 [Gammaproteobacteria bacterium]|nr:hypothetical protein [Gammaproteobacteria bacterium]
MDQADILSRTENNFVRRDSGHYISILSFLLKSFLLLGLLYSSLVLLLQSTSSDFNFLWLKVSGIQLELSFKIDNLAVIMLWVVGIIGCTVFNYSSRYLLSDKSRNRFLVQILLTIFSVIFFILSSNLLTAFIGWQLIGLNLYLLLNHYHYQPEANRAAKKKYIINKLGDMCFLLAIILCYHYYGTTDYVTLGQSESIVVWLGDSCIEIHSLIIGFVFIAIMTKSAQFPFHIWLPDTMQAPTPVSALMHAGVINAGGILLARISPLFNQTTFIPYFICIVGLATLITGSLFKASQVDIKKQLAYSTMSQMGYMVMQSGLGLFSAALFHLIAHGFYKAFLFMNAGNKLFESKKHDEVIISKTTANFIFACFLVVAMMVLTNLAVKNLIIPTLVFTFIALTLHQMIYTIISQKILLSHKIILISLYQILFAMYAYLLVHFEFLINLESNFKISDTFQRTLSILVIAGYVVSIFINQYMLQNNPIGKKLYVIIKNKFYIEEIFRSILLNPLRSIGDSLNNILLKNNFSISVFSLIVLLLPMSTLFKNSIGSVYLFYLNLISILVLIFLLLMTNIGKSLTNIFVLLFFSHLYLITIVLINVNNFKSYFILLAQYVSIFLGLWLLIRESKHKFHNVAYTNKLSSWGVYMMIFLFALMGLPGSVSFNWWFSILLSFIHNPYLIILIVIASIVLAISILHILQDYVFSLKKTASFQDFQIVKHMVLSGIITFNIICGLYPALFG